MYFSKPNEVPQNEPIVKLIIKKSMSTSTQKEPKTVQILTGSRIPINERIEKGLTKFFEKKDKAVQLANQTRSYFFECYNSDGKPIGYAVPK